MVWVGVFERMCMCDIQHACLRKKPLFQCDPINSVFQKLELNIGSTRGKTYPKSGKDLLVYSNIFSIPPISLFPDLPLLPPNKRRKRGDVV